MLRVATKILNVPLQLLDTFTLLAKEAMSGSICVGVYTRVLSPSSAMTAGLQSVASYLPFCARDTANRLLARGHNDSRKAKERFWRQTVYLREIVTTFLSLIVRNESVAVVLP